MIDTPHGPLAALDSGPGDDDTRAGVTRSVALLVPGFTGSKEDFLPILAPILATGRRGVADAQRGQHESPGSDDPAAYSVRALADDLLTVISTLGGPVHLVGHSFGGLVARDALIRQPEAARSLTLLDSGPAALGGNRRVYLELMTPVLQSGGLPAVYAALEQVQAADPRTQGLPVEVSDFLR